MAAIPPSEAALRRRRRQRHRAALIAAAARPQMFDLTAEDEEDAEEEFFPSDLGNVGIEKFKPDGDWFDIGSGSGSSGLCRTWTCPPQASPALAVPLSDCAFVEEQNVFGEPQVDYEEQMSTDGSQFDYVKLKLEEGMVDVDSGSGSSSLCRTRRYPPLASPAYAEPLSDYALVEGECERTENVVQPTVMQSDYKEHKVIGEPQVDYEEQKHINRSQVDYEVMEILDEPQRD